MSDPSGPWYGFWAAVREAAAELRSREAAKTGEAAE